MGMEYLPGVAPEGPYYFGVTAPTTPQRIPYTASRFKQVQMPLVRNSLRWGLSCATHDAPAQVFNVTHPHLITVSSNLWDIGRICTHKDSNTEVRGKIQYNHNDNGAT